MTPKAGCSPVCFWDGGGDGKAGMEADSPGALVLLVESRGRQGWS